MAIETPKLVIVEEEEVLADITAFRLELLGYTVSSFATGEQEWANIKTEPPDLVILDTILPDMDGLELVDRLRSDPKTSHIPLLLFSCDADLEFVQRA